MLFKNIYIYRFTKPFTLTPEQLEEKLASAAIRPCAPQELFRQGWSRPLGKHGDQLVHTTNGNMMLSLAREERLLPASVVKEILDERVQLIEDEQHRKVQKKEKDELKDQIIIELMPKAFKRSQFTQGYIDAKNGWLIINTSSAKKADDFSSFLRKTLGSLPVMIPEVKQSPSAIMTTWLQGKDALSLDFSLCDECELQSRAEEKSIVRCKGLDIEGEEVQGHIKADMRVVKIALNWQDHISFVLNEDLTVKRIKFGELVDEKLEDSQAETAAEKFDATFALMALEFANLIERILQLFGGEDRSKIVESA
ncbi:MAG: recombination-associated protein RdgC [Proteobacteria bacterium]|nr:MAG: recombination-associated protein RdgC [Pseudomonadota bacterium]